MQLSQHTNIHWVALITASLCVTLLATPAEARGRQAPFIGGMLHAATQILDVFGVSVDAAFVEDLDRGLMTVTVDRADGLAYELRSVVAGTDTTEIATRHDGALTTFTAFGIDDGGIIQPCQKTTVDRTVSGVETTTFELFSIGLDVASERVVSVLTRSGDRLSRFELFDPDESAGIDPTPFITLNRAPGGIDMGVDADTSFTITLGENTYVNDDGRLVLVP